MKRLAIIPMFVLGILAARVASAQGTGPVQFGLSGGADFPVSDQKDIYKTGWNGKGPAGLRLTRPWAFESTARTTSSRRRGISMRFSWAPAGARIIDGTIDLVAGPRGLVVEPYFIGGVGAYDLRFRGEDITTGNSFSQSTTRFGWNAGVGVAFPRAAIRPAGSSSKRATPAFPSTRTGSPTASTRAEPGSSWCQ